MRSKQYRLSVADLPSVKRLRVTYRFPAWTGMRPETEDPGGDLRAVEGTSAEVAVVTDRPLANGVILLDDGRRLPLRDGAATVPIEKDGSYHIAAVDQGEAVRLSEDYFIEAQQDRAPSVKIARPGRDARVSPIEEVTVAVEASDDFGLRELALHYSVNGETEKTVKLPRAAAPLPSTWKTTSWRRRRGDPVRHRARTRARRSTPISTSRGQAVRAHLRQSQQSGGGAARASRRIPSARVRSGRRRSSRPPGTRSATPRATRPRRRKTPVPCGSAIQAARPGAVAGEPHAQP